MDFVTFVLVRLFEMGRLERKSKNEAQGHKTPGKTQHHPQHISVDCIRSQPSLGLAAEAPGTLQTQGEPRETLSLSCQRKQAGPQAVPLYHELALRAGGGTGIANQSLGSAAPGSELGVV